ncbi:lipopolysaccharide biosynthesis protein [Crenobacter intestini]|uniref:Lipopolysaccharide biosynthesis protein n=1 Tax=Crenobacter intestini TaxID=2563443 RepID=A0A4T0V1A3_9NEIS|nr:oligosaccharide flippase family protein [Crenobacter intestini]TIC85332.1 hypothetical protein E5K04_04955 [Crenobacter intestini]
MPQFYSADVLKRNAWHFVGGKLLSAVLTFLLLMVMVRALSLPEYGAYVAMIASMELMLTLADMGMHGAGYRYLPEFVLHAPDRALRRFLRRQISVYAGSIVLVSSLTLVFLGWVVEWLALSEYSQVFVWLPFLMLVEGVGRLIRDQTFSVCMRQNDTRKVLLIKLLIQLAGLIFLWMQGRVSLQQVIWLEILASSLALAWSLFCLRHFLRHRAATPVPGWREPGWDSMWRAGFNLYLATLVTQASGVTLLTVLLQKTMGPEAAGVFGFVKNLVEMVARYLPATLFFSILQPKLVASGLESKSGLSAMVNMAGKVNLFVLLPLLVVFLVAGEPIVFYLSGGEVKGTGLLSFGLMLFLLPYSQRLLLETVAMVNDESRLCFYASCLTPLGLAVFWLGGELALGIWSTVAAILFSAYVFVGALIFMLTLRQHFLLDAQGFLRMLASAVAAYFVALPFAGAAVWQLVLTGLAAAAGFTLSCLICRAFSDEELALFNGVAGRHVFRLREKPGGR